MLRKLFHDTSIHNLSLNWHLETILEDIFLTSPLINNLIPSHICRNANKVVDLLANKGVQDKCAFHELDLDVSTDNHIIIECKDLAGRDLEHLIMIEGGGR